MDQNCNLPMLWFPTAEKGDDSPEHWEDRFVKPKMCPEMNGGTGRGAEQQEGSRGEQGLMLLCLGCSSSSVRPCILPQLHHLRATST